MLDRETIFIFLAEMWIGYGEWGTQAELRKAYRALGGPSHYESYTMDVQHSFLFLPTPG